MSSLGNVLLESDGFPQNSDKNLEALLKEVKSGNLGISLSSFEEIYNLTPLGQPFPVGCVKFDDRKNCFVFSWVDEFSKLGLTGIEDYSIRVRCYPTKDYPVLSIIIGIHSGKVDPNTKEDLWYFGECHLDVSYLATRIKLYQLLNSEEVLFCLFDGDSEKLDSYGFSLNKKEQKTIEEEILSLLLLVKGQEFKNHISSFNSASKMVSSCFTNKGLPKSQEALTIYLDRKKLSPKPGRHNWLEYLSI